jgi:hypothetical protein
MPTTTKKSRNALSAAEAAIESLVSFNDVLAKLGAKDRASIERHLATTETEADPKRARLWKRLARVLMTLAPHSTRTIGQQNMLFYIPDGKYRMQVFSLQDPRDGTLVVYCPDVLDRAFDAGLLAEPKGKDVGNAYRLRSGSGQLTIDRLDGSIPNPEPVYKDLTGWNRRALKVTVQHNPSDDEVDAVCLLCGLAASSWARVPA